MIKISRFADFLLEAINPLRIQEKDLMRIRDIISKANGSRAKAIQLTSQQANMITDKAKAYRRYQAAVVVGGPYSEIKDIFQARFEELSDEVLSSRRKPAARQSETPEARPQTRIVPKASATGVAQIKKVKLTDILTGADNEEPTIKDIWRIKDIVVKGGGIDTEKSMNLAKSMAAKITHKDKAIRRAMAAKKEGLDNIANIFIERAAAL